MERLPSPFFLYLSPKDTAHLRATSLSLLSRIDQDKDLLLLLFDLYFTGVHTGTEEYTKIQETRLLFQNNQGTFPLLITTLGRYYLFDQSSFFLLPTTLTVRLCSYGRLQHITEETLSPACCYECARYGHVDTLAVVMDMFKDDERKIYSSPEAVSTW
jgi:hypothetical protein